MKIIDVAAVLGALVWTPHVVGVIRAVVTKPRIRLITQKTAEIGFSSLGPIFNIRLAFAVENKDVVVSGLRVRLTHEDGDEKYFEWQGIRQQLLKLTAPDASVMPFEKEQAVLAIKLNQKDIDERFVQFQEISFLQRKVEMEDLTNRAYSHVNNTEGFDPTSFIDSVTMRELITYTAHSFPWKEGRYTAEFELTSPIGFSFVGNVCEFFLSAMDIEELEKNKANIKEYYLNGLRTLAGIEVSTITWTWRYPALRQM